MSKVNYDAQQWAETVFGQADLGDARRTQRLIKVGAMLASHTGSSPLQASEGNAALTEGAYRLLRNNAVNVDAIAESGFTATAEQSSDYEELLALEDTTTLSYSHRVTSELGDLGGKSDSKKRGYLVHSVLLVEPRSERIVGLLDQQRWCRDTAKRGQRHQNKSRPYEEKESYKWQSAAERIAQRLGENRSRVIAVCDREADIYEYLSYKTETAQPYIIRAARDRRLSEEEENLFAYVAQTPMLGEHTIQVGQRGGPQGRPARAACLSLHGSRVTLHPPKRMTDELEPLTVNAVLAQERHPPAGQTSLCWLILTSEPVGNLKAAQKILQAYALRWRIEEFHKAWKSGAKVEQRRMQTADNLERIAVILAFVAVRLLQLREGLHVGDKAPTCPCTEILEPVQWRILWATTEKQKPPAHAPSQQWAYYAIAKLGGWLDTKGTGRVGWEALWRGWFRLMDRVETYLTTRDLLDGVEL